MSKKGYVATAGGFCVAISSVAVTSEANIKKDVETSKSIKNSQKPFTPSAVTHAIKK